VTVTSETDKQLFDFNETPNAGNARHDWNSQKPLSTTASHSFDD